jgi:hypothetical protein
MALCSQRPGPEGARVCSSDELKYAKFRRVKLTNMPNVLSHVTNLTAIRGMALFFVPDEERKPVYAEEAEWIIGLRTRHSSSGK